MKQKRILFFLLHISFYIQAEQFIYPVAAIDHEGKEILVVYQKSLDDIELWIWNSTTKCAIKGLLSMYIPAGIKMLPSGVGFSFMDEGRLRVKNFYKRSPKTIAIYQPISKITDITWISDDAFYFSAKEGNAYNIFSSNTLGEMQRCTSGQDADYVYPSKVGKSVYCIKRKKNPNIFKIVKINWLLCDFDSDFILPGAESVLLEASQPISYLHMVSDQEGFYLDYSNIHDCEDEGLLTFTCCRLFKDVDQAWRSEKMFVFKIPSSYVIGIEQNRLYESITPLLPQYSDLENIYFVDAQCDEFLQIKKYNVRDKKIEQLQFPAALSCVSPLCVGNILYAGFVLSGRQAANHILSDDGILFLDLPEIMLEDQNKKE